jgi:hypothetical protein
MNFSECFLSSLAARHADFSVPSADASLSARFVPLTSVGDDLESKPSGPDAHADQVLESQSRLCRGREDVDEDSRQRDERDPQGLTEPAVSVLSEGKVVGELGGSGG